MGDIDTVAVDSLKALDPNRPIREADIRERAQMSVKCRKPTSLNQLVGTQYQAGREQIDHLQKRPGMKCDGATGCKSFPARKHPQAKAQPGFCRTVDGWLTVAVRRW